MKSPEEITREMVRNWLAQAAEDLGLAEHLLSENTPYLKAVTFHCQQAAEKHLKAFLVHHQREFPKTHDIGELLDLIATLDHDLAESLRDMMALNPYAVDIRYPDDFPDVSETDAKHALELAQLARDRIVDALHGKRAANRRSSPREAE